MALFLQQESDHLRWAVWKMDESLDMLFALLPDARRKACEETLQHFISEHRKKEWLSVRVLLYTILQEDKQICYTPEGKPYLEDGSAFISISHTKGYVAVLLSPLAPVGVDIEQYSTRVQRISDRFVRSDEQIESYQEDVTWSMLLHWSAKEAVYKCMKCPDADLRKLRLSHFMPQEKGSFRIQEFATEAQQTFTVAYLITSDFVLTWTMDGFEVTAI